ncbi:MAG TPA: HEAT repeat domain-containing protein [Dissulfurispiraceae bacterium]|nr:HEAT repeat domain-containing protein [Dissulfurispiraceae bacterium]
MTKYTPECPYCGKPLARPEPTRTEFVEIISGKCDCGAVYVCDPTGHNVGEAYSDAMALAAGEWNIGDMDAESYDLKEMDYDLRSHSRVYAKGLNVQSGKLIFIRMAGKGEKESEVGGAESDAGLPDDPAVAGMKLKDQVRYFLETKRPEAIGKLAVKDKNVIKWLISFSYDKEDVMTWRAIEAMGYVAKELGAARQDILRDTVRKLLWSMGDESGGIGWSAPEILGEIVRSVSDAFSDIVPILWTNREEASFRPGVVWAMIRISQVRPDLLSITGDELLELANDPNPAVRGYTAVLTEAILLDGNSEILLKLSGDLDTLLYYEGGDLNSVTVAELAGKTKK